MGDLFIAAATMKAVEIAAKLLIHKHINSDAPGADVKVTVFDGITEFAGESIAQKIFGNKDVQKKLDYVIKAAFEDANYQFDFRFSDFQEYFIENNLIFKMYSKDDYRDQIREWLGNHKKSISSVNLSEADQFADMTYQELKNRIEKNADLNAYLAPQRIAEAVNVFLREMPKLNQRQQELPAAQEADSELFRTVEEYLKTMHERLTAEARNQIITQGNDNVVANNKQKGSGNLIQTDGNNNYVFGNIQE